MDMHNPMVTGSILYPNLQRQPNGKLGCKGTRDRLTSRFGRHMAVILLPLSPTLGILSIQTCLVEEDKQPVEL